jgi:predicted nucleic acid-binding protein
VLDSFALLAHLQAEPGGVRVQAVLRQARKGQAEVLLSIINYGESVYLTEREHGLTAAHSLIATVDQMPIAVVEADRKLTFAAAHLKAHYAIAYADAFALTLAQEQQATLLTGDPEFQAVQHLATIEWLPQP